MDTIRCSFCGKIINGKHIVEGSSHYCNDDCYDGWWRETGADVFAREESDGEFTDYNDYMRDRGATIAEDWEPLRREE